MSGFNVGDKATHSMFGPVEILYGPWAGYDNSRHGGYLVKREATGHHITVSERFLTPAPRFSVGDKVTHRIGGSGGEILAGPFRNDDVVWYAVRDAQGREVSCIERYLEPVAVTPFAVGDVVRITTVYRGETECSLADEEGTLIVIDEGDEGLPYKVRLSDGRRVWVHSVEHAN